MANQKQHFHSCTHHQANNSLLIQFLLHELYSAFQTANHYQSLIEKVHLTPHRKYTKKSRELLTQSYQQVTQLAGGTDQSMRIFSWNLNEGIIAKLKQYSSFFGNNLDPQDTDAIQLERHAERAWIHSLECLDLTHEQLSLPTKEPANLNSLIKCSEKLCVQIHKLSQALANILTQFRDDESVLYYLLRHQDQLAELWGLQFLPKLFKKLFPNGKEEVECFLKSRYNKRHFSDISSDLTNKIYQLMAHV